MMKKFFLFLILVFSLSPYLQAQVSQEAFNNAVNYVNCKAMEVVMKKPCNCDSMPSFGTILEKIPGEEDRTQMLASEIETLKREYKKGLSTQQVVDFLSRDAFKDNKRESIALFVKKRRGPVFDAFQQQLQSALPGLLSTEATLPPSNELGEEPQIPKSPEERIATLEATVRELSQPKEGFLSNTKAQIGLYALLGLLVAGVGILFFNYYNLIRNQVNYQDKSHIPQHLQEYIVSAIGSRSSGGRGVQSDKLEQQATALNQLKSELERLMTKVELLTIKEHGSQIPPSLQEQEGKYKESDTSKEYLFLSTPNADGSFNESSAQPSYREGATIYRFTKLSQHKAEFQIDDKDASVKLALQYPDKNIDPVCEELNAFNASSRKIKTHNPGVAELQAGKWKVTRKAKISYES